MLKRIERYHVVDFQTGDEYSRFQDALMSFVGSVAGVMYMAQDPRCVMWTTDPMASRPPRPLYLSPAAVEAATKAGLSFETSGEIAWDELPEQKTMLLGEASDWRPESQE